MSDNFTLIDDLQAQLSTIQPDSVVSRTFYSDERVKVILFGFAAGQELSEHTSTKPAIVHFLTGQSRFKMGDHETAAGPGTWAHMAPNLPHSIYAETEVSMLLYMLQR